MRRESAEHQPVGRDGFSLVELVVALVILTIGILGLAGTTVYVVRQVAVAGMETDRAAALQAGIERMRAIGYDNIGTGTDTVGQYTVSWSVSSTATNSKTMQVITTGPGYESTGDGTPSLSRTVPDTFTYVLLKP